jgi:hypothetical protein
MEGESLQVICDSGNSNHLVDNPAGNGLEQSEGELVRLGTHEIAGGNSAKATNEIRIGLVKAGSCSA